jgi:ABC-2 type transport system ATP-binding protein
MTLAEPQIAVSAANLSRRFGEVQAVRDASFAVERGEIFGLVGPDGAGKTTIMRMLAGVLPPDAGPSRSAPRPSSVICRSVLASTRT